MFGISEEQMTELGMTVGVGGFMLFMLFIIWELAQKSKAGKTGTIGPIRNEVAVVSFPGEEPVAVSVFTRAARMDLYLPLVDQAIGSAARIAVTAVRQR